LVLARRWPLSISLSAVARGAVARGAVARGAVARGAVARGVGLLALAGAVCGASASGCNDATIARREPANVVPPPSTGADGGSEAGVARREGLIRVATFNVRRFFDGTCDTGRCSATDFEDVLTPSEIEAKADLVARGIASVAPDVIALQEIENTACLSAIEARITSLGSQGGGSFALARLGETGLPGSVDVAILARGASGEVRTHASRPLTRPDGSRTTFSRELLEVRMSFGERRVVMFAAHFRSKVDDDPGRRLAEAQATHEIVAATAAELPDALVLLGGDLNDTPGSPPLAALEAGGALLRVASDRPLDLQATYTFQGQEQAIDHLFLAATQATRYVAGSTTAHRERGRGFASSDHGALSADFRID